MEKMLSKADAAEKIDLYTMHFDKILMMCDSQEEVRMLACAMISSAMNMLEEDIGSEKMKKVVLATMEVRNGIKGSRGGDS
jgi:hypothetical protein